MDKSSFQKIQYIFINSVYIEKYWLLDDNEKGIKYIINRLGYFYNALK